MSPAYGLARIFRELSARQIVRAVYGPEADEGYIEEKSLALNRGFCGWLTSLDSTRMLRFDELVRRASADEAIR